MDATDTVKRLLEDPEPDPLDFRSIRSYYEPNPFNPSSVKHILDTAAFFKQQAIEAHALSAGVIGKYTDADVDQVMLQLAVEDTVSSGPKLSTLYNRLTREMHSIWR